MDAHKQNRRLGRGMNILGYDPVWKNRSKARMHDEHFRIIKEAGFNTLRIALHPFRDAGIDDRHRIVDTWFKTLDWTVEQSLSNGLLTILDLHEFITMGQDPIGNEERFLATWKQISERYRDYPSELIFEILNEPNGKLTPELWNSFHREAMMIIRKTNPSRTVIIGPGNWNDINYLDKLELPEEDRNIIVTIHYYRPMEFTHQGASWTGQEERIGIEWKGTAEERQAIVRGFQSAQAWAENHDRPLFLGEFGAYDKADMDSRVRYLSHVARQAEKMGWSWAYWQFDNDFIAYDINHSRWIEPILRALIPSEKE
ncbi:MAG: glycoside hydrolase family 5 protein [Thermoproteota archaeon]